jgi:hypothetical protein
MPPTALVVRYSVPEPCLGRSPHWLWAERKPLRGHDADGQATFRWQDRVYNVARVLLQHRFKTRDVRAMNACGLPQCVRPEHWMIEPSFLGPVDDARAYAVIKIGEVWRLSDGDSLVERDVAFVARVAPSVVLHVIRALYDLGGCTFIRTCDRAPVDPAVVVPGGIADCEECVR